MYSKEKNEFKGSLINWRISLAIILFTLSFSCLFAGEIHDAVSKGNLEKVKQLIEADPSLINATNYWKHTPLHYACMNNIEIAQFLIEKGADVNYLAYNGLAPLHFTNNYDIAKLLIDNGANVDIYDKYEGSIGEASYTGTVLQVKIGQSQEKISELLVQSGAKLDKRDPNGNTELMLAAQCGLSEVTKCLLEYGADINAVDNNNHTALYFAAKHGYKNVVDVLIAKGANKNDIVEGNYGKAAQLNMTLSEGEAYLWSNHGWGYTVKTKEHLFAFNYFDISDTSSVSGLANGYLNPNELQGQNFTMFYSEGYGKIHESAFNIEKDLQDMKFVFNSSPKKGDNQNIPEYRIAKVHESFTQDGMTVHTILAVPAGVGYLVEVDGTKIFFAGLHIGSTDSLENEKYKDEIDYLKQFGPIDIAIITVHGHVGNNGNNYNSYLYMIDELAPKEAHLMAANNFQQYLECANIINKRNVTLKYPESIYSFGERYHYLKIHTSD
jgi:hypothetical protein